MQATFGDPRLPQRFWSKIAVDPHTGCWLWTAAVQPNGYGRFNKSVSTVAHRCAYVVLIGPVPDGLDLDHLCRVRHCANPAHLEPVTRKENLNRGVNRMHIAAQTNLCLRGHSLEDAYVAPKTGSRQCRTCNRNREQERQKRRVRNR